MVYHFCVTFYEQHCFQRFQDGGKAKKLLEEAGISLYKYSEDMYHIKVKREISNNMQCIIIYKKIQFLPIHGCVTSGCRLIPDVLRWGRGT